MCEYEVELMEKLNKLYNAVFNEVMALPDEPQAGLIYWKKKKLSLSTEPLNNLEWIVLDKNFDPYDSNGEFHIDPSWTVSVATSLHFTNQLKRIPLINVPSERKIMQMALNSAQAVRSGLQEYKFSFNDVVSAKS
jgi:hypothetical protein|tara:strand:- start:7275 stop:7679 length:405 start_codon:yes stop_codon:yes gene_type:complete